MSVDERGEQQATAGADGERAFSMRALVLDGTLGGARAWMTAGEIEERLGPPDQTGGSWPGEIWRYGLFEIHFERQRARMIYTDYVDDLDPGAGRTLERWVFSPAVVTLEALRARLAAEGHDVDVAADAFGHDVLRFPSGCRLGFEPGDAGNRWCTLVVEPV